jgi:hypothetical protein
MFSVKISVTLNVQPVMLRKMFDFVWCILRNRKQLIIYSAKVLQGKIVTHKQNRRMVEVDDSQKFCRVKLQQTNDMRGRLKSTICKSAAEQSCNRQTICVDVFTVVQKRAKMVSNTFVPKLMQRLIIEKCIFCVFTLIIHHHQV